MTHIAFHLSEMALTPKTERHHGFLDALHKARRCPCSISEVDNREAFQAAFSASKSPFRVDGKSFTPFTLTPLSP